jgi:hypothetical protein
MARFEQALEPLEHQFDLPPAAVEIQDHGGFKNRSEVNGAGLGEAASLKGAMKLGVFSLIRRLETKLLQGGGARAVACMRGMLLG